MQSVEMKKLPPKLHQLLAIEQALYPFFFKLKIFFNLQRNQRERHTFFLGVL